MLVEIFENVDVGRKFRKISVLDEISEKSRLCSKFSKNLEFGWNFWENLDFGRNFPQFLILVKYFENSQF